MKKRFCIPFIILLLSRNHTASAGVRFDGPSGRLSIHCEKEPLRRVLKSISDRTAVGFVFQDNLVDAHAVSCAIDSLPFDRALDRLLFPIHISFKRIQDGTVVLYDDKTPDRLIMGWVIDASSGNGLPNAAIIQQGTANGTTSGADGYFTLRTGNPDSCTIRVSYIGFHPEQVSIPGKTDSLKIAMREKPVEGEPVQVTGYRISDLEIASRPGRMTFSPRSLDFIPSAGGNNFERALQLLPGVGGAFDRPAQLSFLGGPDGESLVYLDGIPLYHGGTYYGFLAPFHPRMVENVTAWKGPFPSHLGDCLSGIVELTGNTVPKNRFNAGTGIDMFSSSAFVEWPINAKIRIFLAGRLSLPGITKARYYRKLANFLYGRIPKLPGDPIRYLNESGRQRMEPVSYDFSDITGKLSFTPTVRDRIFMTFVAGRENDRTEYVYAYRNQMLDESENVRTDFQNRFTSSGISVAWNRSWNRRFETGLQAVSAGIRNHWDLHFSDTYRGLNHGPFLTESKVLWDNRFQIHWATLRFGAALMRRNLDESSENWYLSAMDSTVWVKTGENKWNDRGDYASAYIQCSASPLRNLDLAFGLRLTDIDIRTTDRYRRSFFDPMVSAEYSVARSLLAGISWGRSHQYLSRPTTTERAKNALGVSPYLYNDWTIHDRRNPPPMVEQCLMTIRHASNRFAVTMEGFYRDYPDLIRHPLIGINGSYPLIMDEGIVKGIEWTLEKKKGLWTGWLCYSFSLANYKPGGPTADPEEMLLRPPWFDRLQQIKGVIDIGLGTFHFSLAGVLASGKPHALHGWTGETFTDGSGRYSWIVMLPWSETRLPVYQRVDVQISKKFTGWIGLNWEFSAAALNVLGHMNSWDRQFYDEIEFLYRNIMSLGSGGYGTISSAALNVPMLGFTPMVSVSTELN
jgi:ferric enterobactin receptor